MHPTIYYKIKILLLAFACLHNFSIVAQTIKAEKSNLIFPLQAQHVHGSSVVVLPNGDLLAAWFQGSGERTADDVKIMGSRLAKGDQSWEAPFVLADTPNLPDCNPVLFLNHQNKLFLVWIAVQANSWEHSILRVLTSTKYQETGSPIWDGQDVILLKPDVSFAKETENRFKELPRNTNGWSEYAPKYDDMIIAASQDAGKRSFGWMTRIKPLLLSPNKIILPLYSDGFNFSMMALSEDDGITWLPSLPLVGRGPIQPALALKKDGTIAAYLRDSGDAPTRVHYSESKDRGKTWEASTKTEIPNTASVEVLVLKDGRWLFVGNDMENGRTRLSLLVSKDEGKTWPLKYTIENQKSGGYSYPSLIQSADGTIHLTYSYHENNLSKSIKYLSINPKSI